MAEKNILLKRENKKTLTMQEYYLILEDWSRTSRTMLTTSYLVTDRVYHQYTKDADREALLSMTHYHRLEAIGELKPHDARDYCVYYDIYDLV